MINSHTHSKYSSDSTEEIDNICKVAIEKGITAIAITDHVALWEHEDNFDSKTLLACKREVFALKERYKNKLNLLFGIELGEHHTNPSFVNNALSVGDLDVVLCSLHDCIPLSTGNIKKHFVSNDFSSYSKDELVEIVKNYYSILKNTAKTYDYDILSHVTYPFRYICVRHKINFDYSVVIEDIKDLLSTVITRNKALELNTANAKDGFFMPDEYILKLYKEMGGELITLGSDAHVAENVANGLNEGKLLLKKCGFTKYYYYEKRKPKIAEYI